MRQQMGEYRSERMGVGRFRRWGNFVLVMVAACWAMPATQVAAASSPPTTASLTGSAAPTTPGAFAPLGPVRILDTRIGVGATGTVAADGTIALQVLGVKGIPAAGVGAVAAHVTVTEPTAAGNVTVYPSNQARPPTSNLNFSPGQDVANSVIVTVGPDGKIKLSNNSAGSIHLIVDVSGYYIAGAAATTGAYQPVLPVRVLDTRRGLGGSKRLSAGQTITVHAGIRGFNPYWSAGLVVNLTVTGSTGTGFIRVGALPTSALNFSASKDVANLTLVADTFTLTNVSPGSTDLIMDVVGYFFGGGDPSYRAGAFLGPGPDRSPTEQFRAIDTRIGVGGLRTVAAGGTIVVAVGRPDSTSSTTSAVAVNITATRASRGGYLVAYPSNASAPNASSVNIVPGKDVATTVIVPVGPDGRIKLTNKSTGSTDVLVDLLAYAVPDGGFLPVP